MKKLGFSGKMYAIAAGFLLITVLQITHALIGLLDYKTFLTTRQMTKMIKSIDKSSAIIPGTMNQLVNQH